ncbi:hypothetical protein DFJ77DRAFT_430195, partial [Powellomyces hirtus]
DLRSTTPSQAANQGTAQRFSHVGSGTLLTRHRYMKLLRLSFYIASITNLRNQSNPAQPNLCVFQCAPTPTLPFKMKLLERHNHSSQFFVPFSGGEVAYLVIVCKLIRQTTRR